MPPDMLEPETTLGRSLVRLEASKAHTRLLSSGLISVATQAPQVALRPMRRLEVGRSKRKAPGQPTGMKRTPLR